MVTNNDENTTEWITRLKSGDESAMEELVDAFYDRLVRLAKHRMVGMPPQVADDEGAVISALRSFFSCIEDGQFSRVQDDHDLWRVLATITARKAIRQCRVYLKQSGEGGNIKRDFDLQNLVSREPSPEAESQMIEEFQRRIDSLEDATLRDVVFLKLEGFDAKEIAEKLSLHVRYVQRKLKLVESIWMNDNEP